MFNFAGKQAVDGAVNRIKELVAGLNPYKITKGLEDLSLKIPIIGDMRNGYNAMTPEEKATFAKNIMLAAAAMAAKSGGKVSF